MDIGSIILGVILVGVCVLPFALVYFHKKKKHALMLISLNEKAKERNCKINEHEFGADFVIGLDEDQQYVFFYKKTKEESTSQGVELASVRRCVPEKKVRSVQVGDQRNQIIERMELVFIPKDENHKTVRFELFDEDVNGQLSDQLQMMEKWSEKLQEIIRNPVAVK